MRDLTTLPLRYLAAAVARRDCSAEAVTRAYAERIAARETDVQAWQHFDPALALEQARALDRSGGSGPLQGVPVGVKDLIDTADQPTTYGSPIYVRHRPALDAACVAACRAAGALIMGKTVTTEFATFQPGPTRNPRAPAAAPHTPGGSSSGSAAAVAAGMVPVAFGTQTAGSIVRPASFCGVVGYKPTHGTLPLAGIKPLAPSLDTLGVLARTVDDAAYFVGVLARTEFSLGILDTLRVGLCQTPHWHHATPEARQALADAGRRLERGGAQLGEFAWPAAWEGLTQAQIDIMGHEALAAFAPEQRQHASLFSAAFANFLAAAQRLDAARVREAYALADRARCALAQVFGAFDVLLAPSAMGEAPAGLGATGDPLFNRLWTLLGVPCVHVPMGLGPQGLPVGVTVIGARWADARVLAVADRLERAAAQAES